MYQRILLPTDGSVGSTHVALQAIDLAERYDATIDVLHVVDDDLRSLAGRDEELVERGRRALDRVERMAEAHDVEVVTTITDGDPAGTILEYAEAVDANLIVMGTHGRSGIEHRLIGSVAEQVVRQSRTPVMTIRLPDTDVTVEEASQAQEIAGAALEREGIDASPTGADRQVHVWVVDAEGEDGSYLVYVDPATQRTSVIHRG